jgi:RNA polymerase sigma factor (sigma-70 family)
MAVFALKKVRITREEILGADDARLIQLCIEGDEFAWTTLVDRYRRLVFSVALRSGLSPDDADDVFQIVFTTLFRKLEGLRDQTRIASWLITAASRESWRAAKRTGVNSDLDESLVDPSTPHAELVAQADRDQRVREAMARLDDRCRQLLTALFLDDTGSSYDQIAQAIGMPVGSIGPTRARCFKKLEVFLIESGLT